MSFDISGWLRRAADCRDRARVKRARGDALRKLDKMDEAQEAYCAAAQDLREPLDALPQAVKEKILMQSNVKFLDEQQRKVVAELVELYGGHLAELSAGAAISGLL
jgi:hypothetical protein